MQAKVTLETAAFQGTLAFDEARVVTETTEHVVVALRNAQGDRLVVTLPKAMLTRLVDWRRLL